MPRGRPRKTGRDVLLQSAELIGWALGGLEREIAATRTRLTALTAQAAQLRAHLGRRAPVATAVAAPGADTAAPTARRRRMSVDARRRISEMMKKRWAERRRAKK